MALNDTNVVNELFWTNYAAEKIYTTFTARAKAVENLQAFIKWTLTLFASGGLVLTFFSQAQLTGYALFFWGVGFACFVFGYYYSTYAGFPITKEMDPNDAASIAGAYGGAVKKSDNNFLLAQQWTIVGVFFIALGILVQFGTGGCKKDPPVIKKDTPLQLNTYLQKDGKSSLVPFLVHAEKSSIVHIRLSVSDTLAANIFSTTNDSVLLIRSFKTDTNGIAAGVYAVPPQLKRKFIIMTAIEGRPSADSNYVFTSQKIPL